MEKSHLNFKPEANTTVHALAADNGDNGCSEQSEYGWNYNPAHDKRGMLRLGRRQELKRRFRYCEYIP